MPVISAEDRRFFDKNGYVIARNAVPPENRERLIAVIYEYLGMDPDNPEDWYRPPLHTNGMLEMYQHQALWDNRQYPRVHEAFADLFGHPRLWVSFDRANMKPPQHPDHPEYDFKGFIHWDMDTSKLPQPFAVQGVLALTDTTEEMGGFQCIPGFHNILEEWIKEQPADRKPRQPDLSRLPEGMKVTPIPMQAGDLLIWDRRLAHGNGHNVSDKPRLAQYITMYPARENDPVFEDSREDRIMRWRERLPPDAPWAPGDPRCWEQKNAKTAELTPLGRKLLGLDLWEEEGDAGHNG